MDCKLHAHTSVQGLRLLIEKMKGVLGSSGVKALEQYRSLGGGGGYNLGAFNVNTLSTSSSIVSSEPVSSFVYLMLAAEKMNQEQASVRKEVEMAKSKLKKLMERIQLLEEKSEDASNKNASLAVKRSENEVFEGLESNFCLSKTEALQKSNALVQEDNAVDKMCGESLRVDMMESVSLRLYHSEKTVKICNKELVELGLANEIMEYLRSEQEKASSLIEEKGDGTEEELKEDVVAVNKMNLDGLSSKMEELHLGSRVKEDDLLKMRDTIEVLEKENIDLISSNVCVGNKLEIAFKEIKRLEDFINMLIAKLTDLDSESLAFSETVIQFLGSFDLCLKLVQQEKDLAALCAKQKLDEMHCQCLSLTSEKNSLQIHNLELHNKVLELEKEQKFVTVQHADVCRIAETKIRKLECELESLRCTRNNMEKLISVLEDSCRSSLEILRLSDEKMQCLMLKLSEMEKKSKGPVLELHAREKLYEAQKKEIMKSLADKENKLEEAKKQCAQVLKGQQLELSKHSNEISKRNDQKSIPHRPEHEAQLSDLRCEHEDECRRLQEELDNQNAKEPRYKSLKPGQNIDLKRAFAYQTATAVV